MNRTPPGQLLPDDLRRASAIGRTQAGPGTARPNASGHGPGSRGLLCGWSATTRISTGTIAATSSPRRPRPCAGSWWSVPAASERGRRGGGLLHRQDSNLDDLAGRDTRDPLGSLAVHEALDQLAEKAPRKAELVKLRYFLGCTMAEAGRVWTSPSRPPKTTGPTPRHGCAGGGSGASKKRRPGDESHRGFRRR